MQIDDVGTAIAPIVVADNPFIPTTAALGAALNKVTTFFNRRHRASFSAVVRFSLSPSLISFR
jgi:hypothetical protein